MNLSFRGWEGSAGEGGLRAAFVRAGAGGDDEEWAEDRDAKCQGAPQDDLHNCAATIPEVRDGERKACQDICAEQDSEDVSHIFIVQGWDEKGKR